MDCLDLEPLHWHALHCIAFDVCCFDFEFDLDLVQYKWHTHTHTHTHIVYDTYIYT